MINTLSRLIGYDTLKELVVKLYSNLPLQINNANNRKIKQHATEVKINFIVIMLCNYHMIAVSVEKIIIERFTRVFTASAMSWFFLIQKIIKLLHLWVVLPFSHSAENNIMD